MTIRQILFPVDFSERSRAVAPFVFSMAQRHKAGVVLMNIIQPPPPLYGGMNTVYPETIDYTGSRENLRKNLEEFAAAELPKIEVSAMIDIGDPAFLICEYAHANAIDLIAMPTHGHGAFRRMLLGSVAAKILHDSKVPVWMDAHAPEPSHRAHPQPRHILAAIDPEKDARHTLDTAVAIAKETGATVDIVTAVAENVISPGMADADVEQMLIENTRELLAKLQFEAGADAGLIIKIGSPAKVIRAAALEKRTDLVVAGRGNPHGLLSRLAANGYAIVREAPCPVLSI